MCQRFSLPDLIDIFLKICDAMAYAHSNGILHLDLKPENIRIDRFGDVLICDWGLSAVIDEMDEINDQFGSLEDYSLNKNDLQNMTIDGYVKGTPGYMAPEQTGQSNHRKSIATDTYSLGAVLYSILTFRSSLHWFPRRDFKENRHWRLPSSISSSFRRYRAASKPFVSKRCMNSRKSVISHLKSYRRIYWPTAMVT